MTIEAAHIRKFVAEMQKDAAAAAGDIAELADIVVKKGPADTGVAVFGKMVDTANALDAYHYVLRGFGIGDKSYRADMPDGHTVETAPFHLLMEVAENGLDGLRRDLIEQARRPRVRSSHDCNPEYYYTLGSISDRLERAINHDKADLRMIQKEEV